VLFEHFGHTYRSFNSPLSELEYDNVLIETCDSLIARENDKLKRENEMLKMELSQLKGKYHV
jgi:hypothetical protein